MITDRFYLRMIFLLFLAGFLSCQKDDGNTPPDPNDDGYKQYGIPFGDVPDAHDVVMYEVNLRAFSPNPNLRSVINKLDHIESLGVNVIWLMPIHPVGQVNSVNSPYSVKDYKAVSQEYGTLADLRDLTDAAHARGMAVIMDWVANHTAWDNDWISNKSWYTQDLNGNIIHPPGTNWLDVADLNYGNSDMRKAMIDAMMYWIFEANVDGFRCDYADGVPFDFWQQAWNEVKAISGRKFILFAEGSRKDHLTAGFDLNFGWQFYGAIKDVFDGQPVNKIFTAHSNEYSNIPAGKHWIRFTTNHDESAWDATPVSLFNGINGALAASVVAIFTGGVPLIYSSQEVGTANQVPFFYNSTINWNANSGMLTAYQKMLQFYSGSGAAKYGQNTVYQHNDIVCFVKSINGEEVVIMANMRNAPIIFPIPLELESSTWINVMTQSQVNLTGFIAFEPYQYFILKH